MTRIYFLLLLLPLARQASARQHYLQKCIDKQVAPLKQQLLCITYNEQVNELEHSFRPWQQTQFTGKGMVWYNATQFIKQDSLVSGTRIYRSATVYNGNELLLKDYGSKELSAVTKDLLADLPFSNVRYTPAHVLTWFAQHNIAMSSENGDYAVYMATINKTIVQLHISKKDCLLAMVTTLNDDDLFGDVQTTYIYTGYTRLGALYYAQKTAVEKINGKIKEEVNITAAAIQAAPHLLDRPANYALTEDKKKEPEISTERYSDRISFILLKHTNDKVMVVQFADYLLVAEAPLTSKNGERVVKEAKKIAPGKPIKYFAFGHYHPHYIGGMRAFVQQGAKIICCKEDKEYVSYLAAAPHTLNPDSLELDKKALQTEEITDSLVLKDATNELRIYHIGKKSEHTDDYLIYYLPIDKLLFEDDLVWVPREGAVKKASIRQAGLYGAIKDLGLDVNTVIQSWPVEDYGIKTVIPFADIEQSMQ